MLTPSLADQILLIGSSEANELIVSDPSTGAQLYMFKGCRTARLGTQILPRSNHLAVVQDSKLSIHLYMWSQDVPVFKCHVAEKMGPTCVTSCGNYLFAGSESGKIYVWDVKVGELLSVWDAHYKSVSAISITTEDSHLITAGNDAVIHVWRMMDILDEPDIISSFQSGLLPMISYKDHVLPVTQIYVGLGGVNARIFTCSMDRTCKIWTLNSEKCLYSIMCPSYITTCIADPMEQRLYMGCGTGKIHVVDLNAAATAVTAATARILSSSNPNTTPWGTTPMLPQAFEGHETGVQLLQVSDCGAFLISGDGSGMVRIWDTLTRQCLRTISLFKGPVTTLICYPRPENLFNKAKPVKFHNQDASQHLLPIAPLKKYMASTK